MVLVDSRVHRTNLTQTIFRGIAILDNIFLYFTCAGPSYRYTNVRIVIRTLSVNLLYFQKFR